MRHELIDAMQPPAIPMGSETTPLDSAGGALYLVNLPPFPILVNVSDMRIASLNAAGLAILPTLLQWGPDATAAAIASRYQLDISTVRSDIAAFMDDLNKQGCLLAPSDQQHWRLQTGFRALLRCLLRDVLRTRVRIYQSSHKVLVEDERRLRRLISSLLILAWWSMRILGWSETLAVWRNVTNPTVAPLSHPVQRNVITLVDRLVQEETAARVLLPCACKERALVAAYCLQQLGGIAADVVLGIISVPFQVHAWSLCAGQVLTDDPERIALFRPILRFPLG